jgi:hypothetical protein
VNFWDRDEKQETDGRQKAEATREAVLDASASGMFEIPEKLTPAEAAWYYNAIESRRDEVYALYFARLNRMDEWLEVYVVAKEKSPARELAFSKLSAIAIDLRGWAELREARFNDKRIVDLCKKRIEEIAGGSFEKWKELYDFAPFGSPSRDKAMREMLALARTIEEWRELYDRSAIGSPSQNEAVENMLLLRQFDEIRRSDAEVEEKEFVDLAATRSPKEWRAEYEKYDIYDKRSETATINIYLSADLRTAVKDKAKAA